MLSHHHSIAYQFVTTHFELLLGIAFAWSLVIVFVFSNSWRLQRGLFAKFLDMATGAFIVGFVIYLPFIALALAVKWGWFY